ncbi:MAG TPA: hypothetical protein VFP53_00385 [Sphingomicrobium sp.]|nr:hypothetical protein [Sphingomicrobium sp.]
MTGLFILIGVPVLIAGLVALLRPAFVRALLGMPDSEAATYGLRIAGMMAAAFGLILAGFSIAYILSAPAGAPNS